MIAPGQRACLPLHGAPVRESRDVTQLLWPVNTYFPACTHVCVRAKHDRSAPSRSAQTIESLRTYLLDESVAAFAEVPGLRFKMWIADPQANRWGAVLLFETAEAAARPLPSRAAALIGYPPAQSHAFDVEATVEGRYEDAQLALRGLAFAQAAPGAGAHQSAATQARQPSSGGSRA